MTYVVTPGTTKAMQAKKWGEEMVRACRARNISYNELGRVIGHGHTAIDHYKKGDILPRTETALAIADTLNWPRLKTMILEYRTYTCAREGCTQTFRNDGGGPKKYCSSACLRIADNLRMAERRRRQAGQLDSDRLRSAAQRRMKGVIATLQGELAVMHGYVESMCLSCEPSGTCRQIDCALRPISPIPYHDHTAEPKTDRERRSDTWTDSRRESHRQAMNRRWSQPGAREAQAARSQAMHDSRTEDQREAWIGKIKAARAVKAARWVRAR